jgi:hypothetical protein
MPAAPDGFLRISKRDALICRTATKAPRTVESRKLTSFRSATTVAAIPFTA